MLQLSCLHLLSKDNNFLWLPCSVLLLFQFSNEETGLADLDGDGCDEIKLEKAPIKQYTSAPLLMLGQ